MTDDPTPLTTGELDDLAARIAEGISPTLAEVERLIAQARAGAPDNPGALVAAVDQLGATLGPAAEVCAQHYRQLREVGLPEPLVHDLVVNLMREVFVPGPLGVGGAE